MPSITPTRQRQPPNERLQDDSWVDQVADDVSALLREHGLELELCVWYDPVAEYLHAVGYDGSAARYFASLESDRAASESLATPGNLMSQNDVQQPARGRPPDLPPE